LGKYSPRIDPADAMFINFGIKNEASIQKAQNKPSTQLIEAANCVERLDTVIKD
jgi:hypothetical protein